MAEPVLQKGSSDPAVRDLQEALKALGQNPGPIDGAFGAQTEAAVRAFQQASGITVDGVVGTITWRNIDNTDLSEPELRNGSTGLPVRRLQSRMSAFQSEPDGGFPYATGGVDGRFGPTTEAAVKVLQQQRGITVDGVVGHQTWEIVDSLENEGPIDNA